MAYFLEFKPSAFKEWKKLDNTVKVALKKKLEEVLEYPKIEANRLVGLPNFGFEWSKILCFPSNPTLLLCLLHREL